MSSGTALAVSICFTAGIAGGVQAAVMGELGERVGIVPAVAFSVLVSFVCAAAALLVWERSFAGVRAAAHEPAWLWVGGIASIYIVLAATVAVPRIGVAATIGLVIAGNLDHGGADRPVRLARPGRDPDRPLADPRAPAARRRRGAHALADAETSVSTRRGGATTRTAASVAGPRRGVLPLLLAAERREVEEASRHCRAPRRRATS